MSSNRQTQSPRPIDFAAQAISKTKRFSSPRYLKSTLRGIAGQSFEKAQKSFEKQTGWTARKIERTLRTFEQLGPLDRLFLGGLIVGNGLVKARPNRVRSASRRSVKKSPQTSKTSKSASTSDVS